MNDQKQFKKEKIIKSLIILVIIILIIVMGKYILLMKKNQQGNQSNIYTPVANFSSTEEIALFPPLVAYVKDGNIWIANTEGKNKQLSTDDEATCLFGWRNDNKKVFYGIDLNKDQDVFERILNRKILINEIDINTKTIKKIAEETGIAEVYYLPKLDDYILHDHSFTLWLVDYKNSKRDKIDEMVNPIYDGGPTYNLLISSQGDKIVFWQKNLFQLMLFDINNLKAEKLLKAKNNTTSYSPLGWGKDEKSLFFREFDLEQSVGSYILDLTSRKVEPLFSQDFSSLSYIHYNSLTDTYVFNGNLKSNQYSSVPPIYLSPNDLKSYKEIIGTSEYVLWINGTKNLSYLEPIDPLFSCRIWITDEYGKNHLLIVDNLRYSDFRYLPVWTN